MGNSHKKSSNEDLSSNEESSSNEEPCSEKVFAIRLAVEILLYYQRGLKRLNEYLNLLQCDTSDFNSFIEHLKSLTSDFPHKPVLLQVIEKFVSQQSELTAEDIRSIYCKTEQLLKVRDYFYSDDHMESRFRQAISEFSMKEQLQEIMVQQLKVKQHLFHFIFESISQHFEVNYFDRVLIYHKLGVLPYGLIKLLKQVEHNRKLFIPKCDSMHRYVEHFPELELIGCGAFGSVMKVRVHGNEQHLQQGLHKHHYAIKMVVLPNDVNEEEKVKREIDLLNKFKQEVNIVRFIDSWIEQFYQVEITQFVNSLDHLGKRLFQKFLDEQTEKDTMNTCREESQPSKKEDKDKEDEYEKE